MDHKSGLMYSFAAIAAVTVLAQADDAAAASTHTVRAGDTLWSISQQHNIPLATLKSVNNLTSDRIAIGKIQFVMCGSVCFCVCVSVCVSVLGCGVVG